MADEAIPVVRVRTYVEETSMWVDRDEPDHFDEGAAISLERVPARVAPVPSHAPGARPHRGPTRARVAAVAVVAVIFTGSTAAAAAGGVPVPRRVRLVAHAIGLPVGSPALDDARRHLHILDKAVEGGDAQRALRAARDLRETTDRLPDDEQDDVEADIEKALAAAAPLLVESLAAPESVTSAGAVAGDTDRGASTRSPVKTGSSDPSGPGRDGGGERDRPTASAGESAPPADVADGTEAPAPDAVTGAPGGNGTAPGANSPPTSRRHRSRPR